MPVYNPLSSSLLALQQELAALRTTAGGRPGSALPRTAGQYDWSALLPLLEQLLRQLEGLYPGVGGGWRPTPAALPLSPQQRQALAARFGLRDSDHWWVRDDTRDGRLSAGDLIVAYRNGVPGSHRLTWDDLRALQGGGGAPLRLDAGQRRALHELFGIRGEMAASVLDTRPDGRLGPGDTLVVSGGVTGGEIYRHTLTAADIRRIEQYQRRGPTLRLDEATRQLLLGLYAADASGNIPPGTTVTVRDGPVVNGRLSVGDVLQIRDRRGRVVREQVLTARDVYNIRFRQHLVRYAQQANMRRGGWTFTDQIVGLRNGDLNPPEVRQYRDASGRTGTEKVLQRSNYWEIVERDGRRYMLMRLRDNQGRPVRPSDAINDVFTHNQRYLFDCATPMRLFNLKATLDVIGRDDFDRHAGRLMLASWYDQHDNSPFDGGFRVRGRTVPAGTIDINGTRNADGELDLFNPQRGDELRPGSTYYFDLPGDTSSDGQGWNAIYLGRGPDNSYRFWSAGYGLATVDFKAGTWIPVSAYENYYLGAAIGNPDIARLMRWDSDRSGIA